MAFWHQHILSHQKKAPHKPALSLSALAEKDFQEYYVCLRRCQIGDEWGDPKSKGTFRQLLEDKKYISTVLLYLLYFAK